MNFQLVARVVCTGFLLISFGLQAQDDDPELPSDDLPPLPAEQYMKAPGGVDMATGQYTYSRTDLSIGGERGISLSRHNGSENILSKKPFGNFSHNWEIFVVHKVSTKTADISVSISIGGRSTSFGGVGSFPDRLQKVSPGPKEELLASGTGDDRHWVYTQADGTVITFGPSYHRRECSKQTRRVGLRSTGDCAYAREIKHANGLTYTLHYDQPDSDHESTRLVAVTSNTGYGLLLEYYGYTNFNSLVKKACVYNLAFDTFPSNPATSQCPQGLPSATYTYYSSNGHLNTAKNALGHQYRYLSTYNGTEDYTVKYYLPGEVTPYLTNYHYFPEGPMNTDLVDKQIFADGRVYDYEWNQLILGDGVFDFDYSGGSYSLNNNPPVVVGYRIYKSLGPAVGVPNRVSPGPVSITNELGHKYSTDYCIEGPYGCVLVPAEYWEYPDDRVLDLVYDDTHSRVKEYRWQSSDGSLPELVTKLGYPTSDIGWITNKPTTYTDPKNQVTEITYDPVHGGVTSIVKPAVNGVRPTTWYTYQQLYARIRNGSSGYKNASEPVWMRKASYQCIKSQGTYSEESKSGSCSGGSSDLVETQFEYGSTSSGNNLMLTGVVELADGKSLRTCFAYDKYGNRIGETSPRANLSECP